MRNRDELVEFARDTAFLAAFAPQALVVVDEVTGPVVAPPALRMPGLPVDRQSPGYLALVEAQEDARSLK